MQQKQSQSQYILSRPTYIMAWVPSWKTLLRRPPRLLPSPRSASDLVGGDTTTTASITQVQPKPEGGSTKAETTTPSPTTSPSLLVKRRAIVAGLLVNAICILAVSSLMFGLRGSPSEMKMGTKTTGNGSLTVPSELPFLVGDERGHGAKDDATARRWIRVLSAKATHPAMYVPADGMVYCPIAKVACAEWRKTLRWMLGIPDWDTGPIHDQGKNGIPLLSGRKPRDVELMMNDDSWLKFVVVRDPADRLLSGFLNKCVGTEWQNCPYIEFMPHRFAGVTERNGATDAKFIAAIKDEPKKVFRDFMLGVQKDVRLLGCRVNSHWRPQYCFCSIARFLDSYHVIPFANMSTEAVKLVDHMQRPSPERADLLRAFMENRFSSNQDSKAQGASTKREKYFSAEVLRIMEQVYAKDYKLFGEHFEHHVALPIR